MPPQSAGNAMTAKRASVCSNSASLIRRLLSASTVATVTVTVTLSAGFGNAERDAGGGEANVTGVRDSAGVRIVESTSPRWTENDSWQVNREPVVDIGAANDDSAPVLARVGGIVPLAAGQVAVVNGSDRQVLVFDSTGQLVRRVGRRGEGPGELSRPTDAMLCGADSLLVNDVARVTLFDVSGAHQREWPLVPSPSDGAVRLAGVAPDCGAFLLYARPERLPAPNEIGVAPATLFWASAPDAARDTLGTFDARRTVRRTLGSGGDQAVSVPWTGETRWVAAGGLAYVALGSSPEVRVYDRAAKLTAVIRWRPLPTSVSDADRSAYDKRRANALKLAPVMAQILPELREFPVNATSRPAHLGILVDDSARIWVRDYPNWIAGRPDLFDRDMPLYNPDDEPPVGEAWQVFDRDGGWLGPVQLPARLTVRAVAHNRVYGVWRDDDGAEHVRVYAITSR
jgi:hypothetical protein